MFHVKRRSWSEERADWQRSCISKSAMGCEPWAAGRCGMLVSIRGLRRLLNQREKRAEPISAIAD